jgi:hypothetical protein
MSLLHRQIASRSPKARSAPLATTVGAVFYVTKAEAIERGRPTDEGIYSLARDIKTKLVYMDPKVLHDRLDRLDQLEKENAGTDDCSAPDYVHHFGEKCAPPPSFYETRHELAAEVGFLDERASKLTPDQVSAQISFSSSFFGFESTWDDFYQKIIKGEFDTVGNGTLSMIDDYDSQYRQYVAKYTDLGYKPTFVPPKSHAGDTFGPVISAPSFLSDIPWTGILVGGLALGGLLLVSSFKPSIIAVGRK